jgi:hypothetical protein
MQKIGSVYVQEVTYNCNFCTVKINNVIYLLDTLVSYTDQSCILSNKVSIFELYVPAIDIIEVLKCFSCENNIEFEKLDLINNSINTLTTDLSVLPSNFKEVNSNLINISNKLELIVKNTEPKDIIDKPIVIETTTVNLDIITDSLTTIREDVNKRNLAEYSYLPFVFIICLVLITIILIIAKNL